jgi:hypothetical protein
MTVPGVVVAIGIHFKLTGLIAKATFCEPLISILAPLVTGVYNPAAAQCSLFTAG